MRHNVPQLLTKMLEVVPGKQTGLAKRLGKGITQPQVSRWLRGQQPDPPNYERIVAVAQKLGVLSDMRSEDVAEVLPTRPLPATVKLKGYVGAGGVAHYYNLAHDDYEEVPAPPGATDQTVAVEIKGKSLGPLFETWLVYYDDVRSPITSDLYGELCVVGLSDDRILIKKITKGQNGTFTLLSNGTDEDIENAEIEWAAKVTDMKPRR